MGGRKLFSPSSDEDEGAHELLYPFTLADYMILKMKALMSFIKMKAHIPTEKRAL